MSRNQNSHFSQAPRANIKRSRFDISHNVTLTCNAGKLVPFECKEVLAGDTFDIETSILARMQTLTVPLMSDMWLDVFYFYVPSRFLWKHFENFMGASEEPWYDETVYTMPLINVDTALGSTTKQSVKKGTVADYLGMPLPNPGTFSHSVVKGYNHLPFRAYVKVWNDWFRNENVQAMADFHTEDENVDMNNEGSAFYGGELLPVNRYRDLFSSCLPEPQKGPEVRLGNSEQRFMAPVYAGERNDQLTGLTPLTWTSTNGSSIPSGTSYNLALTGTEAGNGRTGLQNVSGSVGTTVTPDNLWAEVSSLSGVSINELRIAFATQRFYEQAARNGSNRYVEILEGMFGVTNGDLRLGRSEYLGGQRLRINVNQAIQQSETQNTPLGNIGAYSLTTDTQKSFVKSFTEPGYLLGCLCVRYDHSYSQGFDKMWLRKDKWDFYWPLMASIGEQPILNEQIFASGDLVKDEEVFGYNEAWAEYRFANNVLLGEMRPTYAHSLDFWHLGDDYDSLPALSDEWMQENGQTIDRALAVQSNVSDQFLIDMHINTWATRPMPLFSIPGLDVL